MSPLELTASLLTGLVGAAGAWGWVRQHQHPQYVTQDQFQILLKAYHEAVIRELAELRADLRALRD